MFLDRLIQSLLPREDKFFTLLEAGTANLRKAAQHLQEFSRLETLAERTELAREIKRTESKGDAITKEIFEELVKSFVTPIEREDIIQLAHCIDDVLDAIEVTSNRICLYKFEALGEVIPKMSDLILEAVERLDVAMACIRHMHHFDEIRRCAQDIHRLESKSDDYYHEALAALFADSKDAIEIIKFKEIYEDLEGAMDMCDDAGKVLSNVAIRNG